MSRKSAAQENCLAGVSSSRSLRAASSKSAWVVRRSCLKIASLFLVRQDSSYRGAPSGQDLDGSPERSFLRCFYNYSRPAIRLSNLDNVRIVAESFLSKALLATLRDDAKGGLEYGIHRSAVWKNDRGKLRESSRNQLWRPREPFDRHFRAMICIVC